MPEGVQCPRKKPLQPLSSRVYLQQEPQELKEARLVPEEALLAASRWTVRQEGRADVDRDGVLVWYGWALHAAFIAGVLWQASREKKEESHSQEV